MAEGKIIRKGGAVTAQALAPTITEVSVDLTEIVFTITNNDASSAVILWEIGDATPDENSIELAGAATSSNITVTGLTQGTEYTVSATASVTGKVLSNVTSLAIETDVINYTAATGGTTAEYDDGGKRYKSHTFTSDGTFTVTTVGNGDRNKVDYLIIAGGGGASGNNGGGGGAGGYLTTLTPTPNNTTPKTKPTVTAQAYSIVIGSGGTGGAAGQNPGSNGTNSTAFGETALSGGGGGSIGGSAVDGFDGGSGGGAGDDKNPGNGTTGQGFAGGTGSLSSPIFPSGGGGGASEVGVNSTSSVAGNGGDGLGSIIRTGSTENRAGGGGGGINDNSGTRGLGGLGGGGDAGNNSVNRENGTANTGGGGGAGSTTASNRSGGNGGTGIVIIRYEIAPSV